MPNDALPPLLADSSGLNAIAFRRDGGRMAVADTALRVTVREGERTVWERTLLAEETKAASMLRIRGVAYAPDGRRLYVLATDALIALDAETGETEWAYCPPKALGFLVVAPVALAVRGDGLLAASFDNGAIGAWSPEGELCGLWRDVDTQRHLAFLPDGRLLGDDSFGLSVFDVSTRRRLFRTPLRDRCFGLAVSSEGRVAVRTLHEAWQIAPSGEMYARTIVEPGLPLVGFHPSEPRLALGAAHSVTLVDAEGGVLNRRDFGATTLVSMAYSPAGELFVGTADGRLVRADDSPSAVDVGV